MPFVPTWEDGVRPRERRGSGREGHKRWGRLYILHKKKNWRKTGVRVKPCRLGTHFLCPTFRRLMIDFVGQKTFVGRAHAVPYPTSGASKPGNVGRKSVARSTRLATSQGQAIVWQWESDAYGSTEVLGTDTINLRFPGQYFDYESGLHYNWNRYYNPAVVRYTSPDIIGLLGGKNLYYYANENPIKYYDLNGLVTILQAEASLVRKGVNPANGSSGYSYTQLFDEWLALERANQDWLEDIPPCPRHIELCLKDGELKPKNPDPDEWHDPTRLGWFAQHGDAVYEMRSIPDNGHANQCTYDGQGNVYDDEIPEAGTPDFVSNDYEWDHGLHDLRPWLMADDLNRREEYYNVRPPKVKEK